MDCKICFRKYDGSISQLTPRILTSCGHTLCEYCIKKQKKFGAIVCPFDRIVTVVIGESPRESAEKRECLTSLRLQRAQFPDGVDQLCKNFALLEIIENSENPDPQILYSEVDSEEEEESDFERLSWHSWVLEDLEDPRLHASMEDPWEIEEEDEEEDYEYLHDMYL